MTRRELAGTCAGFSLLALVMTYPQVTQLSTHAGLHYDALFSVWHGLGCAPVAARSAASVRRKHLLSGAEHARLLGRDASPGARGCAAHLAWRDAAGGLQPARARIISSSGRRGLFPGALAWCHTGGRVVWRRRLRLSPVSLRALPAARAVVDLLDSAGAVGTPSRD
jgi:hypothetical protein